QVGSALMPGLFSPRGSRIALTGRKRFQRYLAAHTAICESAAARFISASTRAFSTALPLREASAERAAAFHGIAVAMVQKIAIAACSELRDTARLPPLMRTSSISLA